MPVRVAKSAAGENARTVRIGTVGSLTDIKYEEWVENNRDVVEKESNGQIAYVHIRSMNQPSLDSLPQRDRPLLGREGHRRRHPLQWRRQHRPGADRHPRAASVPVLERPHRRARVGPSSAAGDRRTEGDAHQPPLGLGQRSHPAGFPRPRTSAASSALRPRAR